MCPRVMNGMVIEARKMEERSCQLLVYLQGGGSIGMEEEAEEAQVVDGRFL